jgi:hypothetical protein
MAPSAARGGPRTSQAQCHCADAWGRCADDPATLLHLIACRMGAGAPRDRAPRRDRAVEAAAAGFRENRWSRRHAKPLIDRTPSYYGPLN